MIRLPTRNGCLRRSQIIYMMPNTDIAARGKENTTGKRRFKDETHIVVKYHEQLDTHFWEPKFVHSNGIRTYLA